MITLDTIHSEYQSALAECFDTFPKKRWPPPPEGLELTHHKTKYGIARSNGYIYISEAFVGTESINKLRNTIRHELAHLAAGLRHGHNSRFRKFEAMFNARRPVSRSELEAVHNNISYKWQLFAHLIDGRVIDIGKAHRKTKRFSQYPLNGRRMIVEDTLVKYFEFVAL